LPDIVPTFSNVAIFLPRWETVHQRQVPDNSKLIQNRSPPTVAKEAERETPERSTRFRRKTGSAPSVRWPAARTRRRAATAIAREFLRAIKDERRGIPELRRR